MKKHDVESTKAELANAIDYIQYNADSGKRVADAVEVLIREIIVQSGVIVRVSE